MLPNLYQFIFTNCGIIQKYFLCYTNENMSVSYPVAVELPPPTGDGWEDNLACR